MKHGKGYTKQQANRTILASLRILGVPFKNMKIRDAAAIVATAYDIEVTDPIDKISIAQAVRQKRGLISPKIPSGAKPPDKTKPKSHHETGDFYDSWEWKRCRYDFLKDRERRCQCCGMTPDVGARIVVDHVKPVKKYWDLRLDAANLQILCDDCNMGKGSRDETDWREIKTTQSMGYWL